MHRNSGPVAYDKFAMSLHWSLAVLIIFVIAVSEAMPEAGLRGGLYAWHAALGIAILMLSLVRLIWRLSHTFPAYPEHMARWQRAAARAMSGLFYALMIAIPLSGWLAHSLDAVSRPFFINSTIAGLMPVPILPVDGFGLAPLLRASGLNDVHELTSNLMIALIVLHTGAALKHHLVDRDEILNRMLPRLLRKKGVQSPRNDSQPGESA